MPQSPVIFLSFANDPNGNHLSALKPEQDALQFLLIRYQKKGWGNFYTAATSEPVKLLRDLNEYKDQLIIFHFSGHNEGKNLQFENSEGNLADFRDSSLVAFLKTCKNLKLIFLNACATMEHLKALQDVEVPAIIVTHEPIGDRQAMKFSRAFYDSLVSGDSLKDSFDKAVGVLARIDASAGAMRSLDFGDGVEELEQFAWALFNQENAILDWKLEDEKSKNIRKTQALNRIPGPPMDFVGRSKDLGELQRLLQKEKPVLLLNGLGGIGKTSLAKQYLHEHYDSFDHIVWVSVLSEQTDSDSSFETATEALGNDVELFKSLNIPFHTEGTTKDRASYALNALGKITGNNLLIIDNAGFSLEEIRKELPQPPHWQVLITSRKELPGFADKRLHTLLPEEALKLFYLHYPKGKEQAEEVEKLLGHIGYHTLTLELFAKTCEKSPSTNPAKILKLLQEKRLEKLSRKVFAEHGNRTVEVYSYLLAAFELHELTEVELSILIQWAILPPQEIEWELLCQLYGVEKNEQEEFEDNLIGLQQKGWIEKGKVGTSYRMHQLIQEVIRNKHRFHPGYYKIIIQKVETLLDLDDSKENSIDKFIYLPFGVSILDTLYEGEEDLLNLQINVARIYKDLGEYEKAMSLLQMALSFNLKRFGENHPSTNRSRSNLALVYHSLGKYEKAANLLERALNSEIKCNGENNSVISLKSNLALVYKDLGRPNKALGLLEVVNSFNKKYYGESHPSTARSRSNLATVYQDLREFEKAATLLELALGATLEILGEDNPLSAIRRSNLALVYRDLGEYEKALDLLKKVLNSVLRNYGEDHPSTANSQSNLATVYRDLGENKKAADLLEKALNSDLKSFGEEHPSTAIRRWNLATVYVSQGKVIEAKNLLEKAYKVLVVKWGVNHPNTKNCKNWLDSLEKYL